MRFHNGCWLLKEGFEAFSPQQVYEVYREERAVEFYMPAAKIAEKGDTLAGVCLSVRISAPAPEVIRVQAWHFKGAVRRGPEFALRFSEGFAPEIEETDEAVTVKSGHVSVTVYKENGGMRFERDGKLLTLVRGRDLAYVKEDWRGFAYDHPGRQAYMCQQLALSVDERIYGFGEQFTPFVKNGQSVRIWNEDGGTSTEQSYKNIPFYLSSRDYGVFVNTPAGVEFEAGSELVNRVAFSVKGEELDYFLIGGGSMKEVLERYTDLTGKPSLMPQWSFGLWLSTSFTTDYDEKTVMSFIDGMLERGIPLSVFHFDCCWMREFHWTDFIWDERVFPDPSGMVARIHERGIRVCVWINPYIGQASSLFGEGMEKGYFLKRADGSVWQWDMWQPGLAIVDFTNREAAEWYQEKLRGLLDMGVDCIKTDFGERIPTDVVYSDGSDPERMHNYYTYLYNKAVYEVLVEKRGEGEAVLFARSATAGCQRFPVHWGGDCNSDYESMEQSLRGGLSLTSSGFGYWSHDIGGFESQSTPDVYNRWAAFGLLSTHSRLHGSSSYRVPWIYGEESVETVRFFTRLKLELLPYLYSSAVKTSRTGIPMMRSMALEFEEDPACGYLDKQYMLGRSLLIAPIFNEEGEASYYLPKGLWTGYLSREAAQGGGYRRERHGYCSIPLWVRENTILAAACGNESAEYDFAEGLEFKVFGLTGRAEETVCRGGGDFLKVTVSRDAGRIEGQILPLQDAGDGKKAIDFARFRIRLINTAGAKAVEGACETDGADTLVTVSADGRFAVTV